MQGNKLYVGNLDYSVTEEQLETLFAEYGEVKQVNIIEGRGFGFVEMSSPEEAEQAKDALNETNLQGRTLKIDEAHPPRRRDYGGGYEGGGFRRNSSGGRDNRRGGRGGGRGRGDSRRGGRY